MKILAVLVVALLLMAGSWEWDLPWLYPAGLLGLAAVALIAFWARHASQQSADPDEDALGDGDLRDFESESHGIRSLVLSAFILTIVGLALALWFSDQGPLLADADALYRRGAYAEAAHLAVQRLAGRGSERFSKFPLGPVASSRLASLGVESLRAQGKGLSPCAAQPVFRAAADLAERSGLDAEKALLEGREAEQACAEAIRPTPTPLPTPTATATPTPAPTVTPTPTPSPPPRLAGKLEVVRIDPYAVPGMVTVYFRYVDESGAPLPFPPNMPVSVAEDGYALPSTFTDAHSQNSRPRATVIALDVSGSMQPTLPAALSGLQEFLTGLSQDRQQVELLTFNSQVQVLRPWGPASTLARDAPNLKVTAGGDTALYDAVDEALNDLAAQSGMPAIVILTDGSDTSSHHTLQQVLEKIVQRQIPLFIIGLKTAELNEDVARQMTGQVPGGGYLDVSSAAELATAFHQSARQLENVAIAVYVPLSTDPGTHRVTIALGNLSANGQYTR